MLPPGAYARVIQHTTVKEIKIIQCFRKGITSCKYARQGDIVVASVKKVGNMKESMLRSQRHLGSSMIQYKRGDLVRALVVRTKKEQQRSHGFIANRSTGIFLSFPGENQVILLGPNGQDATMKQVETPSYNTMLKNRGFSQQI